VKQILHVRSEKAEQASMQSSWFRQSNIALGDNAAQRINVTPSRV